MGQKLLEWLQKFGCLTDDNYQQDGVVSLRCRKSNCKSTFPTIIGLKRHESRHSLMFSASSARFYEVASLKKGVPNTNPSEGYEVVVFSHYSKLEGANVSVLEETPINNVIITKIESKSMHQGFFQALVSTNVSGISRVTYMEDGVKYMILVKMLAAGKNFGSEMKAIDDAFKAFPDTA
ncbi:hypothetical protein GCK72_003477 [Caenorhabditis remanei]|uniref:C2H2-type domain-containing protein n=1 Tax=Caenorhabditis remanei TaxID=31234 RepID=A0A6A5HTU8_CAERE|nr:hypothetical protein GCK72_003477 [Caenorhabditis remanei]KAF1771650.1 hypothetical protein GCK72_003477 [Caenorhabditis remanei]